MSAYLCIRHATPDAFLTRAEAWLLEHEAENNLILGIAAQLRSAPASDAYLATLEHDGLVTGCAFRTPPFKLGVTRMPTGAIAALVDDVTRRFKDIPGVLGAETAAGLVAEGVAARQGARVSDAQRRRIYELRSVLPPARLPAGRLRLAQPADATLIEQWLIDFAKETSHGPLRGHSYAQTHIANKTAFVWDDDGVKSTALWAGMTPHGVRIGFVFTPPQERGRGYATAVTAGASQRALDSGYQFCCLYTDLANPVSNAIYPRIGYRPVCDVVDYIIT